MLRRSREEFYKCLGTDFNQSPKRLWSTLKRNSKTRSIPDIISSSVTTSGSTSTQRIVADNPNAIANLFNKYFASVYTKRNANNPGMMNSDEPFMTELTLTEAEVSYVLRSLDTSKATGPDGIPARLLTETANAIAPSLWKLFNMSILAGTMPDEWKIANIIPVYKKGDKEHTENYRPISLLCITSKVLERCILNNKKCRLLDIVNICQHGFIAGRSCVTNLLETLDYVGSCLDNGGHADIIYMDMSKAFDKVDHGLLIQKLRNDFGIGGNLLKWFQSY